ncbi:MAG: acyloxyacyl hydrolase [Steroidobacteraceae bacterium]
MHSFAQQKLDRAPRIVVLILGAIALLLQSSSGFAANATGASPAMIGASVGHGNVFGEGQRPARYGVNFSPGASSSSALMPSFGAVVAEDDSSFVYVAIRREFWLNYRWGLVPSFGVGAYQGGSELDLGHSLEFRSGLEVTRRFNNDFCLGLAIFHVSNGGLSERNPGTESVVLSVYVPMEHGRIRGRQ